MNNEELVQLYQQGDKQALEKLLEINRGIVYKVANKFCIEGSNSIDIEDLEQEGYIGLMVAAERYDINNPKKAKFTTYAVHWIYSKINRYVNAKSTNEEISLNTPIGEEGDNELMDTIKGVDYSFEDVEEKIYIEQLREELEKVMHERTSLKERNIIKLHYGWDTNKTMTYNEVGELLNITGERVRQIKARALRRMRNTTWGVNKAKEIEKEKSICKYDSLNHWIKAKKQEEKTKRINQEYERFLKKHIINF